MKVKRKKAGEGIHNYLVDGVIVAVAETKRDYVRSNQSRRIRDKMKTVRNLQFDAVGLSKVLKISVQEAYKMTSRLDVGFGLRYGGNSHLYAAQEIEGWLFGIES